MKRATLLLLLSGCASLVIPLYDEDPVLARYPGLKDAIVTADQYEIPEGAAAETEWVEAPDRVLTGGDAVRIEVKKEPDLTRTAYVNLDGTLVYPRVGSIYVKGKTVREVEREIRQQLAAHLKNPQVTIKVPSGSEGTVDVVGEVAYPGSVTFRFRPWITGAITRCGSFHRAANLTQVLVVRVKEKKVIVCDLHAFAAEGKVVQNIRVADGDVIVVTELYPPDEVAQAREWCQVADFIAGKLTREQLIAAIKSLPPAPWEPVRK